MAALLGRRTTTDRDPFRSAPALLVVGLATLAAGIVLFCAAAFAPGLRQSPADDAAEAATSSAAVEFYAAEDEALATGNVRRFMAAASPAFVDHRGGIAAEPGRIGLVAEVTALRAAQPGARLTVAALMVSGDRALVYVSWGTPPTRFGAVSAPARRPGGDAIEVVRVVGGVVAERWRIESGAWPPIAPDWSAAQVATSTADAEVCLASACH